MNKITDIFDKAMLDKYNTTGPRYTSYPTAVAFHNEFSEEDFACSVEQLTKEKQTPSLSLYLHIPFCHSLCYYCGCNKIVTRNQDKVETYLTYIKKEITLRSAAFSSFEVKNIHFGGGTPSFLSPLQFADLLAHIKQCFNLSTRLEQSIEIDPRRIELPYIDELFHLGFNRISIGVQDVNKSVQEKINRVQSTKFVKDIIERAKSLGIASVNIDLIYGLPGQSNKSVETTLNEVKKMNPDRISLFSYAHMPSLFPAQRKIKNEWMPSSDTKFSLFKQSIQTLSAQGYRFIGMDHFAKDTDELSISAKNRTLHRNFQGYTSDDSDCLLGLGVSSISNLQTAYSQNVKKLKDYYQAIDALAHDTINEPKELLNDGKQTRLIEKGLCLTTADQIHRAIINQLMCNLYVDKAQFSEKYDIDFDQYFSESLAQLTPFIDDNLLTNNKEQIKIHPRGRLLVRNICMNFDQYLSAPAHQMRYSRVI